MSIAQVVGLNHVARESSDVKRLADFYKEVLGLEEMEVKADFGFDVIWLSLPTTSFQLHLIQRNPESNLPEGPLSATSAVADPTHLPRGHHLCFTVSNFDSVANKLKEKGIKVHESFLQARKVKQIFFFDPDGNGLEIASEEGKFT